MLNHVIHKWDDFEPRKTQKTQKTK